MSGQRWLASFALTPVDGWALHFNIIFSAAVHCLEKLQLVNLCCPLLQRSGTVGVYEGAVLGHLFLFSLRPNVLLGSGARQIFSFDLAVTLWLDVYPFYFTRSLRSWWWDVQAFFLTELRNIDCWQEVMMIYYCKYQAIFLMLCGYGRRLNHHNCWTVEAATTWAHKKVNLMGSGWHGVYFSFVLFFRSFNAAL